MLPAGNRKIVFKKNSSSINFPLTAAKIIVNKLVIYNLGYIYSWLLLKIQF